MKLVTYRAGEALKLGALGAEGVLDLGKAATAAGKSLPDSMLGLIDGGDAALAAAKAVLESAHGKKEHWLPATTRLAAPIPHPRKNVFCVGQNYKAHIAEMARSFGREPVYPKYTQYFTKPATTVVGNGDEVKRHAEHTQRLDYEVELAVVIGRKALNVSAADALSHVFGYTVVNDVTARDAQTNHGQFFKGKSFDTFCPMGPCIVTRDEFGEPAGHRLWLTVNGKIRQDSNTSDLLFGVPEIIANLCAALTLEPGDVIATGTPSGVAAGMKEPGFLQSGDEVIASVEGIGELHNRIV